jgi:DNA-binding NarL/FixJ family response regulator
MPLNKIRIAIADDHQIIRDGLISMLDPKEFEIIGEADNGISIIELVRQTNPDIVLMDIQMPKMDGIQATKIIIDKFPSTHIIALTMHGQDSYITEMMDAGASGYLLKTAMKNEILEAISSARQNKQYYCKTTTATITKIIKRNNKNSRAGLSHDLSETDMKIIKLICDEYNSEEIGRLLFLSKRTIDGARLRIQLKINVSSTAGIVKFALENGIYKTSEGV